MEDKLESYRLRKRRLEKVQSIKEKFFKMLTINTSQSNPSETSVNIEVTTDEIRFNRYLTVFTYQKKEIDDDDNQSMSTDTDIMETTSSSSRSWLTYVTWMVYFLIWATLYAIAVELKFGSVYFMLSLLIGICINTRVKPRGKKEASAYSVFNENCEAIDGTFKAEMFEKQLGLRQL